MIELTEESVADAMVSCYGTFNLKIGIAFSTHKEMYDFAMALQMLWRDGQVPSTHYKRGIDEIWFDTGSSIRMFDVSEPSNLYGYRFDRVVYDAEIKDEDVLEHLRSCEVHPASYWLKRQKSSCKSDEMEIDTQPIDDFLNGFKVIG